LTAGILVLQAIEQDRPFQRLLIAERNVRALVGYFQEHFPDGPPVGFAELGQFLDDFGCTHGSKVARQLRILNP
jgi:hypothetical protein